MKSKLPPNNCITCGVDLNHCADKDLANNKCGFCSPPEPLKEIEVEGKKYHIKSTLPLILLLTVSCTAIVSLAIWQSGTTNQSLWIMIVMIVIFVCWTKLLGYHMLKEKKQ